MNNIRVKTPCVGMCTATSLGDKICRGCGRYDYEVRDWNAYSNERKKQVLTRIKAGGFN